AAEVDGRQLVRDERPEAAMLPEVQPVSARAQAAAEVELVIPGDGVHFRLPGRCVHPAAPGALHEATGRPPRRDDGGRRGEAEGLARGRGCTPSGRIGSRGTWGVGRIFDPSTSPSTAEEETD